MADGFVSLPPDSSGKKIDSSELTVGGNLVERQRVNISDPTSPTAIASVNSLGALAVSALSITNTFAALTVATQTPSFDAGLIFPTQHTLVVLVTGAPATCTVTLQGSLDNINWFDLTPTPQVATSSIMFSVVQKPMRYIRGNVASLTGGTSPTITFVYAGVR